MIFQVLFSKGGIHLKASHGSAVRSVSANRRLSGLLSVATEDEGVGGWREKEKVSPARIRAYWYIHFYT